MSRFLKKEIPKKESVHIGSSTQYGDGTESGDSRPLQASKEKVAIPVENLEKAPQKLVSSKISIEPAVAPTPGVVVPPSIPIPVQNPQNHANDSQSNVAVDSVTIPPSTLPAVDSIPPAKRELTPMMKELTELAHHKAQENIQVRNFVYKDYTFNMRKVHRSP